LQTRNSIFDILHDGVFQGIAGLALALGDGRLDELDQAIDGAGERVLGIDVLDGRFDGAAAGMSENDDEWDVEFRDGILGAAFDGDAGTVDYIAGDADDEEFANANVKQDFRRDAGIGAGDDDGFGKLGLGERSKIRRATARMEDLAFDEALIAGEKLAQGFVGGEDLRLWFSGC